MSTNFDVKYDCEAESNEKSSRGRKSMEKGQNKKEEERESILNMKI